MPNNRIFYACQAVALEPLYPSGGTLVPLNSGLVVLHGVQSVGLNTTFNLEQVFELGQISIYENIENVPDVEMTLEKVLDGYPIMYHVATSGVAQEGLSSTARATLVARSKQRTNAYLGIYPEERDTIAGSGASVEVQMTGMYVSSIGYTLPVEGNCTESVTLVGNHKGWSSTTNKFVTAVSNQLLFNGGTDIPKTLQYAGTGNLGGVQRRENVDIKNSIFPMSIYGVTQSATSGNAFNASTSGNRIHVQNFSINCDLSRESIQELGRKSPYYRFANFPVEVTSEIEVIAESGDFINAYETGDTSKFAIGTVNYGNNTSEETIVVKLHDGTVFDLGRKNRLASVNYGGADAGGGNATMTYSYTTFNDLTVTHPQDPASATSASYAFSYNGQ